MNAEGKKKVTPGQREALLNYMENKENMRSRKLTSTFTYKDYQSAWEKLISNLNHLGLEKSVSAWQKYWNDMRSRFKRKAVIVKTHQQGTGGGPPLSPHNELTSFEERMVDISSGNAWISGHSNKKELGLPSFSNYSSSRNIDVPSVSTLTGVETTSELNAMPVEMMTVNTQSETKDDPDLRQSINIHPTPRRSETKKVPRSRKKLINSPFKSEASSCLISIQEKTLELEKQKLLLKKKKVQAIEQQTVISRHSRSSPAFLLKFYNIP